MISSEKARYLSGVVFVPILILFANLGRFYFLFLVTLVVLLGAMEFYGLANRKGAAIHAAPGVLSSLVVCWYAYAAAGRNLVIPLVLVLLFLMVFELFRRDSSNGLNRIAASWIGVVYVGLMGSHLVLLRELPRILQGPYADGSRYVLLVFLLAWGCDTGAYLCGSRFGRHPLIERISPRKSIEGALGGLAFSVVLALAARPWFAQFLSTGEILTLGFLVGTFAQVGDLVESLMKRDANAKDSSRTIPGHGGVLDRFDSLLFTAPLAYYYLRMILS